MNSEIKIIYKLPIERWKEFKNLRIEAIENDQIAFSTGTDDALMQSEDDWKKTLEENLIGTSITIFAECDNRLVGMARIYMYKMVRYKHNASLQALYVSPEYRNRGIGKLLIESRMSILSQMSEIINVICEVFSSQPVSIELHKKLGFVEFAHLKDFVYYNGVYYDSYQFLKRIRK